MKRITDELYIILKNIDLLNFTFGMTKYRIAISYRKMYTTV